ncbi:hypothetical protein BRADI_1g63622v3 [Brachypodium distachyon]|uniref:Uncharacterized protein n=1 Tax=Brachypodium distachyon TaxID=15368 RepID=A0A2K2DT78_BRADI|nr:hypothetical protein BRADI_1g63622v3 [Brachypodium distachyon]
MSSELSRGFFWWLPRALPCPEPLPHSTPLLSSRPSPSVDRGGPPLRLPSPP